MNVMTSVQGSPITPTDPAGNNVDLPITLRPQRTRNSANAFFMNFVLLLAPRRRYLGRRNEVRCSAVDREGSNIEQGAAGASRRYNASVLFHQPNIPYQTVQKVLNQVGRASR